MRSLSLLGWLGFLTLGACIDHPDKPVDPINEQFTPGEETSGTGGAQTGTKPDGSTTPAPAAKDPKSVLQEVVYVLFEDHDGGNWMCTGTLISKDVAITAAHCLDEGRFHSWTIVAPLARDKPRVSASNPRSFSYDYETISEPDVGILTLDEPIELPAYAQLTDITTRIEKGDKVSALAIVRQEEDFEAPFKAVTDLQVQSTTKRGYDRGFGTQYFSHGGDSGSGLFLLENGQATHKLIAIAREPEPDQKLDHFTRVDADLLEWIANETGGGNEGE